VIALGASGMSHFCILAVSIGIALVATTRAITHVRTAQALLCLTVSLLALALVFLILGAPFVTAFEFSVYAGAVLLLVITLVLILSLRSKPHSMENPWLNPRTWAAPAILTMFLSMGLMVVQSQSLSDGSDEGMRESTRSGVGPLGSYLLSLEMASMLLLSALVTACQLAEPKKHGSGFADSFLKVSNSSDKGADVNRSSAYL
jgi:NADH-quinone oxidoreductase subunit J